MREPLIQKRPIDPAYQSGPIEQRHFTDILFLIIFLAYIGLMTYIGILGLVKGDPDLLFTPFDSSGHQCKYDKNDPDYSNYPVVVVWKQPGSSEWISTCVKGCQMSQQSECKTNSVTTDCNQIVTYPAWQIGPLCVPEEQSDNAKNFFQSIGLSKFIKLFQDIKTAWPIIGASIGISAILSLIFVGLLQICVGVVVWSTIILFLLAFGGFGVLCLILPHNEALKKIIHFDSLPISLQSLQVLQGVAITSLCLAGVLLVIVCCLYSRIRVAIGIMKAAGDFVKSNCVIYIVPVITLLIQALTLMAWIAIVLFLASCGQVIPPSADSRVPFGWVDWSQTTRYFLIVQIIGLVWILLFFSGSHKYIISSAVAIWYYEEGSPDKPILRSIPRLIKSIGSVALGSFLIMITVVARLVLSAVNYIYNRAGKQAQNKVAVCCLRMCECLVSCFERVVAFISDKAYIMMAISGKSFCVSAAEGVGVSISCLGQTVALSATTKVFGFIGKLLVTGATTFICLILITSIESISYNLFSTLGPILVFALVGYCISSLFIEYYRMIAQTLLMCYCIQKQFSGSRAKCPRHMRHFLQEYVDQSSQG